MSIKHGFVHFPSTLILKKIFQPIKFFHPTKLEFHEKNVPYTWTSYSHRRSYKSNESNTKLNLQFLKGLLFFIGSLLFVGGNIPNIIGKKGVFIITIIFLIGSTFFVAGAFVAFWIVISSGKTYRTSKWFQPYRIDYWSNLIQLVGALLFQINSTTSLIPTITESKNYSRYLIYLISTIASINFVIASYLKFIEAFHKYFEIIIKSELWWEISSNLFGSIFFFISSLIGLINPKLSIVITSGFLIGSVAFVIGSALKIDNSTFRVPSRTKNEIYLN
jgi:hypothetical protein